jgi:topoisomerase-4 subunit A
MTLYDDEEYLTIITNKQTGKRIKLSEFELMTRARKGIQVIRDVKTNPYRILKTFIENGSCFIGLKTNTEIKEIKSTELPIADRYSTGTAISNQKLISVFKIISLEKTEIIEEEPEPITLQSVDERIMTIDDFLDNFSVEDE